jgi:predicted transposase YbfD/YdcC
MDDVKCTTALQMFQTLTDPRRARGQRYPWPLLLTLIVAGMATGEQSVRGIARWLELNKEHLVKYLQLHRGKLPSESTVRRALWHVDVKMLEVVATEFFQSMAAAEAVGPLQGQALDGKDLRGARAQGAPVHLLSLVQHGSGIPLAQVEVGDKTNEITAAPQLLAGRDLRGVVVTMDALLTQRDLAQQILDQQGHYLMVVKANQPRLLDDIETLFRDPPWLEQERAAEYGVWESCGRGHGRLESRKLEASTALNDYVTWPGIGQVLRRHYRTVHLKSGAISEKVTYGITSLTPQEATPEQLERLWRGHWTIENSVHRVRDVTMGEDAAQVHKGSAAHALAIFRNLLIVLFRRAKFPYVKDGIRYCARSPRRALRLLGALPT